MTSTFATTFCANDIEQHLITFKFQCNALRGPYAIPDINLLLWIQTENPMVHFLFYLDRLRIELPTSTTTHRSKQSPKIAMLSYMCAGKFRTTRLMLDTASMSIRSSNHLRVLL